MPVERGQPLALIVEDNPTNLMLVRAVLQRAGYRTAEARTAEEARARLLEVRPDVILMDIQLPGQDGLSLTRELKAEPETAAIPVVALTAHAMVDDRAKALAAGCDAFITKPINTRTFSHELAAALRVGERWPSGSQPDV